MKANIYKQAFSVPSRDYTYTRPIFRAKKYNVVNKQTDTVALFSGH